MEEGGRRKKMENSESDVIPMDVWCEIFKRLPARSLCVCLLCGCKSWNSLIRSREFIAAHLATRRGPGRILWATTAEYSERVVAETVYVGSDGVILGGPEPIMGLEGKPKQKYCLLIDDSESESERETYSRSGTDFQFPFEFPERVIRPVEIIACVNGVLLLTVVTNYQSSLYHTILWNPMVGKWLFLPQPEIQPKGYFTGLESFGFGYKPSQDDLRIVRLLYIKLPNTNTNFLGEDGKATDFYTYGAAADVPCRQWKNKTHGGPPTARQCDLFGCWPLLFSGYSYLYPPEVEVYSVNQRIWKRVACNDFLISSFAGMTAPLQCYLDASVHWLARDYNNAANFNAYSTHLLVFNFETETFRTINLPPHLAHLPPYQGAIESVAPFRASLSVFESARSKNAIATSCTIWFMRDYSDATSWARLFTIPFISVGERVLCFSSTADKVLVSKHNGEVMMYLPRRAEYQLLGFKPPGGLGLFTLPYACSFKESLYLLS